MTSSARRYHRDRTIRMALSQK
jgi:hypothetical protein